MRRALLIAIALVIALPHSAVAARRNGIATANKRTLAKMPWARTALTQRFALGAKRNSLFDRPRTLFGAKMQKRMAARNARFARRNSLLDMFQQEREPTPDEIWWNEAAAGKIPWTQFIENLETIGKAAPFETQAFSKAPQRYTFLGKDTGHKRPKFVVVRDLQSRNILDLGAVVRDQETGEPVIDKATGKPLTIKKAIEMKGGDPRAYDHSVSIATPNPKEHKQPVWLHQVKGQAGAEHLGRMVRDALGKLPSTHNLGWATQAYVNMPGVITVPRLHAHGVWRSGKAPKVKDWDAFLSRNNYQQVSDEGQFVIYRAPRNARGDAAQLPLLAVAKDKKLSTAKLGAGTDSLLGQMYVGVANTALQNPRAFGGALERGKIAIDSTDNRLVVRVFERPPMNIEE